jgi:hypothetical protein
VPLVYQQVEELRADYAVLFDPDVASASHAIQLDATDPPDYSDLARRVRAELTTTGADAVEVRLADELLGVSTRKSVGESGGTLAVPEPAPVGVGDHATLTGESSQYRAIRYVCREKEHEEQFEMFRVFHDSRAIPSCPTHSRTMELAGWI